MTDRESTLAILPSSAHFAESTIAGSPSPMTIPIVVEVGRQVSDIIFHGPGLLLYSKDSTEGNCALIKQLPKCYTPVYQDDMYRQNMENISEIKNKRIFYQLRKCMAIGSLSKLPLLRGDKSDTRSRGF